MLRKMRRRFVLAAMAAMLAAMTLLLVSINCLNYSLVTRRLDQTLSTIAQRGGDTSSSGDIFDYSPDTAPLLGESLYTAVSLYFSVYCDEEGRVTEVARGFFGNISDEDAAEYAREVLRRGADSGFYGDFRYLVQQREGGSVVKFLSAVNELQVIRSFLAVSILVEAAGLLIGLGLVLLLSKRAIAPYARNIARQKQFITDAGHELKTPLTAIAASVDVLSMEQEGNEWVESIQKQTLRLSKLVNNLVTLSRLDEEAPFPERAPFSLSEAAWEASEPFSALARAKGLRYEQNIQDGLSFYGDRTAIQQLISILLDNAVKYASPGGEIRFSLCRRRRNAVIAVYNTCALGELENLERLFDRFYRPDKSRAAGAGGTGLGLSIARASVEAHGGRIHAKSPDGKGLLFEALL